MEDFGSFAIEIFPGKTLNINKNLEKSQQGELTKILQKHSTAFAWEYTDMKGIDPKTAFTPSTLRKTVDQLDNIKEG